MSVVLMLKDEQPKLEKFRLLPAMFPGLNKLLILQFFYTSQQCRENHFGGQGQHPEKVQDGTKVQVPEKGGNGSRATSTR